MRVCDEAPCQRLWKSPKPLHGLALVYQCSCKYRRVTQGELYKTDDFENHADILRECQLIADEDYVK